MVRKLEKKKRQLYAGLGLIAIGVINLSTFLIVFSILNPPFLLDYLSRIILLSFPFLIFGMFTIANYAKQHGEAPSAVLGVLGITRRSIKFLLKEEFIGGEGTWSNPYRFLNPSNLPFKIVMTGVKSYFHINQVKVDQMELFRCVNIKITQCDIKILNIVTCSRLIVRDNKIGAFKSRLLRYSVFEGNKSPNINFDVVGKHKIRDFPLESLLYFSLPLILHMYFFAFLFIVIIIVWCSFLVKLLIEIRQFVLLHKAI
jgi:hypothetical protein